MSISVRIPPPLRSLTGGQAEVEASGGSVGEVIQDLDSRFPGLRGRIYKEGNELNRFVSIFLNDQDVRLLDGGQTAVCDGDVMSILPLIAGG